MDLDIISYFGDEIYKIITTEKSLFLKEFPYDVEILGTEAIAVLQTIAINANVKMVDERFKIAELLAEARKKQKETPITIVLQIS